MAVAEGLEPAGGVLAVLPEGGGGQERAVRDLPAGTLELGAVGHAGGVRRPVEEAPGVEEPPAAVRRRDDGRFLDDLVLPGPHGAQEPVGGAGQPETVAGEGLLPQPAGPAPGVALVLPQQVEAAAAVADHARVDRAAEIVLADERP